MVRGHGNYYKDSSSTSGIQSHIQAVAPHFNKKQWSVIVLAILFLLGSLVATAARTSGSLNQQEAAEISDLGQTEESSNSLISEVTDSASNAAGASVRINLNASTNVNGTADNPGVEVRVNGQEIAVPEDGDVSEQVPVSENPDDGIVNVNIHTNTSGDEEEDSRTRIRIDSDTESEVKVRAR